MDKLIRTILSPFPVLSRFYARHSELFLYVISGVLSMLVSISVQYAMAYLLKTPAWANTIASWTLAATAAFFMCRFWVYPESRQQNIIGQATRFYISRLAVLSIETLLMYLAVDIAGQNEYVMKLLTQVFVTGANYIMSQLIIFKKKEGNAHDKQHGRQDTGRR